LALPATVGDNKEMAGDLRIDPDDLSRGTTVGGPRRCVVDSSTMDHRASATEQESGVASGMAQTQAESAVMASTAAKFDSVNSSLTSMLNTLMSELSTLSGTWKGLGAAAFEQVKQQYAEDLKSLNQALSQTAAAIRDSGTGYDTSDTNASDRVSKSSGSFNLPL
jgi:WXG100 family type VII secretion target